MKITCPVYANLLFLCTLSCLAAYGFWDRARHGKLCCPGDQELGSGPFPQQPLYRSACVQHNISTYILLS